MAGDREIVWLHQVRPPVPTINSMAAMYTRKDWPPLAEGEYVEFMSHIDTYDHGLTKAMKLYYYLNNAGVQDRRFGKGYNIDYLDDVWGEICHRIGMPGCELPSVPRDTNSHRDKGGYGDYTWNVMCGFCPEYGSYIARLCTMINVPLR
jgi:hypothetical protein